MKKYGFELIAILLIATLFSACQGVKTASGGSGGMVQVFIKGKDSLLCHAGPIEYTSQQRGDRFEMDHTYLKVRNQRNQVVCNFSLFSSDPNFNPQSLTIQLGVKTIEVNSMDKFFAEGFGKKKYHYRYSFSVADTDFRDWMLHETPVLVIGGKKFSGGKSYRKSAEQVYRQVLFDAF